MTYTRRENCQIMETIISVILKFNPMTEKGTMANHTSFAVVTFRKMNSFASMNSIVTQHL